MDVIDSGLFAYHIHEKKVGLKSMLTLLCMLLFKKCYPQIEESQCSL